MCFPLCRCWKTQARAARISYNAVPAEISLIGALPVLFGLLLQPGSGDGCLDWRLGNRPFFYATKRSVLAASSCSGLYPYSVSKPF